MPEPKHQGERSAAQRAADHQRLARLSDTLVPALVQKLTGSGLGELEVREGEWRIRLRRPAGSTPAPRRAERPRIGGHLGERPPASASAAPDAGHGTEAGPFGRPDDRRALATSPAVGVFRPASSIGARVRAGDRIGIVDLLGIPQDVLAPIDGTLVDVFVQAGEAVEYGEELAAVETEPETPAEPAADDEPAGEA